MLSHADMAEEAQGQMEALIEAVDAMVEEASLSVRPGRELGMVGIVTAITNQLARLERCMGDPEYWAGDQWSLDFEDLKKNETVLRTILPVTRLLENALEIIESAIEERPMFSAKVVGSKTVWNHRVDIKRSLGHFDEQ